ncbi:MAG: tetratricopeptide repeat protein [Candidatus Sumerlaeaceae bacterium]|jgi:tetratricopeptide (TPR) repeat protein
MQLVAKTSWKEVRAVLLIWACIFAAGIGAVILLNLNASRLINHIEYVEASRFARAQVLYDEAMKYAQRVLEKAGEANRQAEARRTLPPDDPDFKRAVELFGKAFALDPRDPYAAALRKYYEILAHCYTAVGMDTWATKMGARALLCDGNNRDAIIYAGSVAARDPSDYEAWMLQVDAQMRAHLYVDAEATLLKMEAAGAPPQLVHELRAELAEKTGNLKKAIQEYQLAVEKNPSNLELRKKLQLVLIAAKRRDEALKILRDGLAYGGDRDPNFLHRLATLELERGDPHRAVTYLEKAVRMEPASGDLYFTLAQAYQKVGKEARAFDALQEALRRKPELRNQLLAPQE